MQLPLNDKDWERCLDFWFYRTTADVLEEQILNCRDCNNSKIRKLKLWNYCNDKANKAYMEVE